MTSPTDRFIRQADLVPRKGLENRPVTVIGCGAIGRQVALQLAAIGVPKIRLHDFDRVEDHNITTQGFRKEDVGLAKVEAVGDAIHSLDPTIEVLSFYDRYRPKDQEGDLIFCLPDKIDVRSTIWENVGQYAAFWGDARMLGETLRILTVARGRGSEHYPTTLFKQEEAEVGRCTARSTIYAASIAAALLVHQFTRYLREIPTTPDLMFNLLEDDFFRMPEEKQPVAV